MIILASGSPRRKELLEQIGIEFKVIKSECDEDFDESLSPDEAVKVLSLRKSRDVFERTGGIVIGADTVVAIDGRILGKPKDEEDAFDMLKLLSGRTHSVFTGLTVIKSKADITTVSVETKVTFKELDDNVIREYISTGEPMDKAGAYGIQAKGEVFAEKIDGDFFNVVGLPVSKLWDILKG
jgi:septum formation protein